MPTVPSNIDVAAKTFKIPPPTRMELQTVQHELDNHVIIQVLSTSLGQKGPTGAVGSINVSKVDCDGLQSSIDKSEAIGPRTAEARMFVSRPDRFSLIRSHGTLHFLLFTSPGCDRKYSCETPSRCSRWQMEECVTVTTDVS